MRNIYCTFYWFLDPSKIFSSLLVLEVGFIYNRTPTFHKNRGHIYIYIYCDDKISGRQYKRHVGLTKRTNWSMTHRRTLIENQWIISVWTMCNKRTKSIVWFNIDTTSLFRQNLSGLILPLITPKYNWKMRSKKNTPDISLYRLLFCLKTRTISLLLNYKNSISRNNITRENKTFFLSLSLPFFPPLLHYNTKLGRNCHKFVDIQLKIYLSKVNTQ